MGTAVRARRRSTCHTRTRCRFIHPQGRCSAPCTWCSTTARCASAGPTCCTSLLTRWLVRSGVFATTLQVFSRIGIVWGILRTTPEVQTHGAMASLLIMWSLTEVVRYAFYTVQLLKVPVPAALLWVRYSLFIVAYPVGITSELVLAVLATPHIQKMVAETDAYSIRLPNAWNFGLDYYWLILCCLLLYVPGAPFLYKHMLKQRKSKLAKLKAA